MLGLQCHWKWIPPSFPGTLCLLNLHLPSPCSLWSIATCLQVLLGQGSALPLIDLEVSWGKSWLPFCLWWVNPQGVESYFWIMQALLFLLRIVHGIVVFMSRCYLCTIPSKLSQWLWHWSLWPALFFLKTNFCNFAHPPLLVLLHVFEAPTCNVL